MASLPPEQVVGMFLPNKRLIDVEGGPGAVWGRMGLLGAAWVCALWPDHTPDDARAARRRGIRVMLRAPGEGMPAATDVLKMIRDFKGLVSVIVCGNEPPVTGPQGVADAILATHLDAMDHIADTCAYVARQAGIVLCTPGWTAQAEPPDPLKSDLHARWWNTYDRFGAIAAHCYGHVVLDGQLQRVGRWQNCWRKPVYINEAGIAARDLINAVPDPANYDKSMSVKATRYAQFVRSAAAQGVRAVTFFIDRGSTLDWATFNTAGVYDEHGTNSYHVSDAALSEIRDQLGD